MQACLQKGWTEYKKTKSARRRSLSFFHIVARAPPARRVGNARGQIPQKWRSDSTPLTHENRSRTKTSLCGPQSIFTAPSPCWQYTFAHQNPSSHIQNQHQPRHRFWRDNPGCNLSAIGLRDGIAAKLGNARGSIPLAQSENRSRTKTLLCGLQSIFPAPSPWWQYTFAHQIPSTNTQNQHQPRHRFWRDNPRGQPQCHWF